MKYVSRVPGRPLDGLIDDLYYLEGAPPYARLTLPPMPAALLIINLGDPFRIRAGLDSELAEYADGCVITTPTRALRFDYPPMTRSVGVHVKPWGLAPFLPMPAAELCDRAVTVEQIWGRSAVAELRDRLATAGGPHKMLTLLEEELRRRLSDSAGLRLVHQTSGVIAATGGTVAIGDLRHPAAVPARPSWPRPGRLATAGGLIFYRNSGSRPATLTAWEQSSCTPRCRWTVSSPTTRTSPGHCSTGCPMGTLRWTTAAL